MNAPAPGQRPDLILHNARVLTLDEGQPAASLVVMRGDRIILVASDESLNGLALRGANVIDCRGQTLIPGFIDAHCHILAYASSLLAVECGPRKASSIDDIKLALSTRAADTPSGRWIRGTGYEELELRERQHPSRRDLDEAAPRHPVSLTHRSGHACVLNSVALARVGIGRDTPDPPTGVIQREDGTGEPTGLLLEMDDYLDGLIPRLSERELEVGIALASRRMLSLGITSVQDATRSNSPERWDTLTRLKANGSFGPRITMMAGSDHLDRFLDKGLHFGAGNLGLSFGAVKIMLTMTTGSLQPTFEELLATVRRARDAGFQVAVHAVESEAVDAAVSALTYGAAGADASASHSTMRDRIEHCSECPPDALRRLAGSGIVIVSQPGFLYYSGRRYLSEVANDLQPWLYRFGSFMREGIPLAAGSDAPVIEPNPLVGIYAAVTRRSDTGEVVGDGEAVSADEALRMYTINAAYAAFQEADRGSIEVGKAADLVVLDRDPTRVEAGLIAETKVTMTVVGGRIVWRS